MKFTLSILNNSFLQKLESSIAADSKNFLGEILIYPAALSKYGNFELSDFAAGLPDLKGRKLVLVWDLLPDDEQLLEQSLILKSWLKFFKQSSQIISIRFQDPGVGFFLQQNHPDLKLQLSLERFSHNLHSASCWEKIFQPQLEKIILSNLTPLSTIQEWLKTIKTPTELLGIGRLEIFYSPRKLVSGVANFANGENASQDSIQQQLKIESIDRLGSWNGLVQNSRGSVLFNAKDICVLDCLTDIKAAGVDFLRLEPYQLEQFAFIEKALKTNWDILANLWGTNHIAGFLKVNRTDAQFRMLKNKNLKAEDKEEIGVVIESGSLTLSQNYTVLKLQKKVNLPCNAVMYNPEGKKLELKITELQSVVSKKIEKNLAKEGFYTLPYVPHAVASSKLFLRDLN